VCDREAQRGQKKKVMMGLADARALEPLFYVTMKFNLNPPTF
jgi:hypothetical protein